MLYKGKKNALCGQHICPPLCCLSELLSVTISFIRFLWNSVWEFATNIVTCERVLCQAAQWQFYLTQLLAILPTYTDCCGVKFGVGELHKMLQDNTATHTLMFSLGYWHVKKFVDVLDNKCKVYAFAQQITGRQSVSQSPTCKCCHYDVP